MFGMPFWRVGARWREKEKLGRGCLNSSRELYSWVYFCTPSFWSRNWLDNLVWIDSIRSGIHRSIWSRYTRARKEDSTVGLGFAEMAMGIGGETARYYRGKPSSASSLVVMKLTLRHHLRSSSLSSCSIWHNKRIKEFCLPPFVDFPVSSSTTPN